MNKKSPPTDEQIRSYLQLFDGPLDPGFDIDFAQEWLERNAVEIARLALSRGDALLGLGGRVRHIKRGSTYVVIGRGAIQSERPLRDNDEVVIYQGEADGNLWARPPEEFDDAARFEKIKVPA